MGAGERNPVRIDLRLYKTDQTAIADLTADALDFVQMNPRQYLLARKRAPGIQPLVRLAPPTDPGAILSRSTVLFTRANSGIKSLSDLRGKSFLFGLADSMATFWTKVYLVEAGVRAKNLSSFRYLDRAADTRTNVLHTAEMDLGNPFSEMTPVEAVLDGKFDAAVVTERRYRQVSAGENLLVLKRFPDAGLLIAGKAGLSSHTSNAFQQAMVRLKQPEVVQWLWGYSAAFQPSADAGFEELRRKLSTELQFEIDPADINNETAP
jgi:ABC-type phosphate/phosphonate transport system substrate-binding protein